MKKNLFIFSILFAGTAVAEDVFWLSDGLMSSKSSCAAGGNITAPAGPYKYGYQFVEWVPASIYDTSVLDTTENTSVKASLDASTQAGPWRAVFSYGAVLGVSTCSPVVPGAGGNVGSAGNVQQSNCYCRVVAFTPDGTSTVYAASPGEWWYVGASGCGGMGDCGAKCANKIASDATFRGQLYGAD